jgi:rhodanese-related sulfurtransferase
MVDMLLHLFKKIPTSTPHDAFEKMRGNNIGFIDVRTSEEYADGHAQGAKNLPLHELHAHTASLKDLNEVYVICRSGGRSSEAVQQLIAEGIHAVNISGGTLAWHQAGLPMEHTVG